jgi:hypothetical protein
LVLWRAHSDARSTPGSFHVDRTCDMKCTHSRFITCLFLSKYVNPQEITNNDDLRSINVSDGNRPRCSTLERVEKSERTPMAIPRELPSHRGLSPVRRPKAKKSGDQDESGRGGLQATHRFTRVAPASRIAQKHPMSGGCEQPENSNSVRGGAVRR